MLEKMSRENEMKKEREEKSKEREKERAIKKEEQREREREKSLERERERERQKREKQRQEKFFKSKPLLEEKQPLSCHHVDKWMLYLKDSLGLQDNSVKLCQPCFFPKVLKGNGSYDLTYLSSKFLAHENEESGSLSKLFSDSISFESTPVNVDQDYLKVQKVKKYDAGVVMLQTTENFLEDLIRFAKESKQNSGFGKNNGVNVAEKRKNMYSFLVDSIM